WFRKSWPGDFDLEHKEDHGRPNKLDDDELKTLVEANTRTAVRQVAKQLGVRAGKISTRFNRIGKTKKLGKWMSHKLNDDQTNRRFEVLSAVIMRNKNDPFGGRIVTCDKK
ncbi:hypothetical protein Angca_005568, partial [Angiostrongylus cantonensis]